MLFMRFFRQHPALTAFTLGYLVVFGLLALTGSNTEFVFYAAVMLVLITLIVLADARAKLSIGLLVGLSLWGLLHMAGGNVPIPEAWPHPDKSKPVLYSLWLIPNILKYDQLVHFFGFYVTTMLCWHFVSLRLKDKPPVTMGFLFLVACAGMGFGALNEIVEFAATKLMRETNVGGYDNTLWDLIFNALGALTAAVVIRYSLSMSTVTLREKQSKTECKDTQTRA